MQKLRRWLTWLKDHRKDWPVFISLIVFCLNIELVVTPHSLKGTLGLSGRELRLAAGAWSSVELCWWIWFSFWLFREKIRKLASVNKAIELGREFFEEFSLQDFFKPKLNDPFIVRRVKTVIYKHIRDFDLDTYQEDGAFMELFGFAKGVGYFFACSLVFIFGLMPLFWLFGLMMCRMVGWRMAYVALFVSNFIKNYFFALIYEKIGFWWLFMAFVLLVMIISAVIKRGASVLKNRSQLLK